MQIVSYLLIDTDTSTEQRRSYRGYTTDLKKRLHRHRLKKGARYTRKFRHCEPLCYISGFADKKTAMSFEWFTKKTRVKKFNSFKFSNDSRHSKILSRFCATLGIEKFKTITHDLTVHLSASYCENRVVDELSEEYNCSVICENFYKLYT